MRLVIPGPLPGLNEFIRAERGNKYAGNQVKKHAEAAIAACIRQQLGRQRAQPPVQLRITWVERDRRRDRDNVAFAKKFILDALVRAGVIPDDGWDMVTGFRDAFALDRANPRVEVEILQEAAECGESGEKRNE